MQALQREVPQTGPQGWEHAYAHRAGTPLPQTWATRLVHRLVMTYGTRFWQAYEGIGEVELAQHWARELAGFTGAEIAAGLAACKTRPWPPTLPEFMALCRPWMDAQVAFQQAVAGMSAMRKGEIGNWPHPAVYWAAVRVGTHDVLACGWQTMRNRWEAALAEVLAQGAWHPIPAPAAQLPAPGATSLGRDEAQRLMAQVRQVTGQTALPGSHVTDHKAWARKILADPKNRAAAAIRMARQALGLDSQGVPA